jgi:hypothetical protein
MTRILGVDAKRAALVALSLVSALACGGAIGCGSSSTSSSNDSGVESGSEGGKEGGPADTGPDVPTKACAEPTFAPKAGSFATAQSVTISTTTKGATIFYTTDGTNPNANSTVYSASLAIAQTTTIRALCSAPDFADSTVASATYTITIPPGTVSPPVANPAAGTFSNDFHLSLTTVTAGATICFTLDGSTPTCTAGVCQGTSQTYNAQTQVAIDGTVTDPDTGIVKVNALACKAGGKDGVTPESDYTLQVATPTLQGPSPGALVYNAAANTPNATAGTATNGATGLFTATASIGTGVSCTNGTPIGMGVPPGTLPSPFPIPEANGDQTYWLIGCKPGYAASKVLTAAYTVTLNNPTFNLLGGATVYDNVVSVKVDDSLNSGAGGTGAALEYTCVTTDTSAPTCAAAAKCGGTGQKLTNATAVVFSATSNPVNVNGASLNAIACAANFTSSGVGPSGAYDLKLDPIKFSPVGGTPIPTAGATPNMLAVTISQTPETVAGFPYAYICSSVDGTTPTCACPATGGHLTKTTTPVGAVSVTVTLTAPAAGTLLPPVAAIGCLSTPPDAAGDVFAQSDTPPASADYQSATITATPTILPTVATQNNVTPVTFQNNDTTATTYFCYATSTTSTAPAVPTCGATGVLCGAGDTAAGVVAGAGAVLPGTASLDGPSITTTATIVTAVACDAAHVKSPSGPATNAPITYDLLVGTPTISPNGGPINLGANVTFSTVTAGTTFHYTTNGSTPTCASGTSIPATGASPGPYTANYTITGAETGGVIKVIGCEANYTSSANVASTAFTYTVAAPTFKYGTGTYDDTLADTITVSPAITGTWLCIGTGASCGATAGSCGGLGVSPTVTTFAAGAPPTTSPSASAPHAVTVSGTTLNAVACAVQNSTATAVVVQSAATVAVYTLDVSGLTFTPTAPGPGTDTSVTISLTPTTMAPDGTVGPPIANGATTNAYICASATAQSIPPQPAVCATLVSTLPAGWTCNTGNSAPIAPPPSGLHRRRKVHVLHGVRLQGRPRLQHHGRTADVPVHALLAHHRHDRLRRRLQRDNGAAPRLDRRITLVRQLGFRVPVRCKPDPCQSRRRPLLCVPLLHRWNGSRYVDD